MQLICKPEGASVSQEHAPLKRSAMSATLAPHRPLFPTTTLSPGSTRLAMQASMPAWPVPLTMSTLLSVWKT